MRRVVHLQINLAELPRTPGKSLKHVQLCTDAGEFARLKDSRDPPSVVHQLYCASDAQILLSRVVFINDHVIVILKAAPFYEAEAATQFIELIEINAAETVKTAKRLNHGPSSECDMWLLHEEGQ